MASITIRSLPSDIVGRLKALAVGNGRCMEQKTREIPALPPRHRLLAVMFLLMTFPVACGATISPPDESVPVILVAIGQEFEVRLPGNPGTGFTWAIEHLPRFLEQPDKEEYLPDRAAGSRIGAGGTYIWRFRASAAGEDEVRFVYRRPWEKDVPPARSAERRIVVKE